MKSIKFILEKRSEMNPVWLTIYSDLMTNLMLFFLLMYGMTIMPDEMKKRVIKGMESRFKPQMTETRVNQVLERVKVEEAKKGMDQYFVSENLKKYAKVQIDEERIRIILQTPLLFDSGNVSLREEGKGVLAEVAKVLKQLNRPISIEGHTDNTPITSGSFDSNWELSYVRSLQVLRFMQLQGVNPVNMRFAGYGEWRPLYPNDIELGRELNRRVEINVLREVIE